MKDLPTTEERVWAVLAHLSALALGMGIVLPVVGWSEQRRKSKYASFQCLQALGYQSLGYTAWLLAYLILIMILMVALIVFAASSGNNAPSSTAPRFEVGFILVMVIMIGALGIYFLLPIVAAVFCAMGRDFHYPIMGKRLARYLTYESEQTNQEQGWLIEDHEDRWVVAMGHFSVIIALWGMLIPFTAWILQGKRSLFLKFQSVQMLVFQAFVNLLLIGTGFLYLVGLIPLGIVAGAAKGDSITNADMSGLFFFLIFMLLAFAIIMIVPVFHIMGQWAGYRVLKGDDYRYPLVGKLVEKYGGSQLAGVGREHTLSGTRAS
jgi:uncharacterized Tic20 family protein